MPELTSCEQTPVEPQRNIAVKIGLLEAAISDAYNSFEKLRVRLIPLTFSTPRESECGKKGETLSQSDLAEAIGKQSERMRDLKESIDCLTSDIEI